jgi:hypothetical protein
MLAYGPFEKPRHRRRAMAHHCNGFPQVINVKSSTHERGMRFLPGFREAFDEKLQPRLRQTSYRRCGMTI